MSKFLAADKNLALLQGDRCGIYRGPTAAVNSIPGMNAGSSSAMVDPQLFEELIRMGVTSAQVHRNALSVQTKTGLRARIPVVIDPLRDTTLNQPVNGEAVSVFAFDKWLTGAQAVAKATGSLVYTWRSNVFSYQRNVLASARLDSAWPVFWVLEKQALDTFAGCIGEREVRNVSISRAELLVSAESFQARASAPELPMPEPAIALLAKIKPHTGAVQFQVPMNHIRPAIRQIKVLAAAHRIKDASVTVSSTDGSLRIRSDFLDIEVPGVTLSQHAFRTTSSALMALDAIAGDVLEIVQDTSNDANAPLVVRGQNISLLLAIHREGTS